MRDAEVVATIVAGEPDGLAAAYDRYADSLYTYCRSMLPDPADAADAAQDAFVIAASRAEGLRDPERLRAWLYAIARNECLRLPRDQKRTPALDEAPEASDEGADASGDAGRAELCQLIQEATAGLTPGDRELIELHLRHELDAAEVAGVLGVSRNHAHSLLSRARDQLAACMGVLLVGRTGRDDCHELSGMLSDWDGHLTVLLRKRLSRHVRHCATCESRRAFAFSPALILEGGAAVAATTLVAAPAALRAEVLHLATGQEAAAAAHRVAAVARAGSFGRPGFPQPARSPEGARQHGSWPRSPRGQAAAAAGLVVAVAVASAVFALHGGTQHAELSSAGPKPAHATSASPPARKAAATRYSSPPATPPPASTRQAGPMPGPASAPPRWPASGTSPASGTATSAGPATASPSPPATPATPVPGRSPAPPATPPARPGTVAASPAGGYLRVSPDRGATITLTAVGGPVSWSAADTSRHQNGQVTISPASGHLSAGQSVTVTVRATWRAFGQVLTVYPGNTVFIIWIGGNRPR
jgi:RNA polymerase sigma factor (sigma-70 family)